MTHHIHIIGPSNHTKSGDIDAGIQTLKDQGYRVSVAEQVYRLDGSQAGTIEDRGNAINDAFQRPEIDIIMTSRGGNGSIHLLDHLDFSIIKENPKPFIGYSDATILLNAIHAKTGLVTLHGPTVSRLQTPLPPKQQNQFWETLQGHEQTITWNDCLINTDTVNVQGCLIGGNLSAFQTLIGTSYNPVQEGVPYILFFEDYGDEASRYDRILGHLKQSGILHRASAILFGDFHVAQDTGSIPFGKSMDDIIHTITNDINVPVITHCPFGHQTDLWTLPVGRNLRITGNNGESVTIAPAL